MSANQTGAISSCTRFEDEVLERLERGEALDRPLEEHVVTCVECSEARRIYGVMTEAIARTAEDVGPPEGWEEAVRTKVRDRRNFRRWRVWGGLAAAAALVLVLLRLPAEAPVHAPLQLTGQVVPSDETVRGLYAKPGDELLLSAEIGERRFAELRLYRDEAELVLRCSDEPPCVREGETLTARVVLPVAGVYQPLLMASDRPWPETAEGFDRDAGRALEQGAEVTFLDDIDVR